MSRTLTQAEFDARMKPAEPNLDRLEQITAVAEKRAKRARSKLDSARAEHIAAMIGLCHAKAERTAFIARQGMLL